jgi:hypothetical protein
MVLGSLDPFNQLWREICLVSLVEALQLVQRLLELHFILDSTSLKHSHCRLHFCAHRIIPRILLETL